MGIPDSLHAQQPSLQTSRSPFPSRSSPHRFSLQYNPFILIIMALTCQSNPLPLDQEIPHGHIQGIEHKLISRIVFGTLNLHKSESPLALLDHVFATGCNAFDCAAIYGGGKCEELLGEWISQRKINHEDVFVITKGGCGDQETDWTPNLAPAFLEESIKGSLERLNLDVVDLFMLHRDDTSVRISEIVDTMNNFIKRGFVKTWGVSHRLRQVAQAPG